MDEEKQREAEESNAEAPLKEEPKAEPEPPKAEEPKPDAKPEPPKEGPKEEPKAESKNEPHPAEIALAERLDADIAALPDHAATAMRDIIGITGPLVGMRVLTVLTRHQILGGSVSASATSPGLAPDEMVAPADPAKINWQAASAGLADRLRRVV